MKKLKTTITRNYCYDWTANNAIREWVTNALDAPSTFEYSFDSNQMTITSVGASIPTKCLALGVSTKRGDSASVGVHGEGIVVAMGVALREGLSLVILNGDKKWIPIFEYDEDYEEDVLVIHEEPLSNNNNLTFIIDGVTDEIKEDVIADCLYFQEDMDEWLEGSSGRVHVGENKGIFVGGVYVCKESSLMNTYDFHPSSLKLNRDRKSVDSWDLKVETSKLLSQVLTTTELAANIKTGIADIRHQVYSPKDGVGDACYDMFVQDNGEKLIGRDQLGYQKLVDAIGSDKCILLYDTSFTEVVMASDKYRDLETKLMAEAPEEQEELTPLEELEDILLCLTDVSHDEGVDRLKKFITKVESRGLEYE